MKNVSKLALFVAAGMVSAGVNAGEWQLGENTVVELEGEYNIEYAMTDTVKSGESDDVDELGGKAELDLTGERELGDGITGFVAVGFEFETFEIDSKGGGAGEGDNGLKHNGTEAGIEGGFGELVVGDSDNIYEDLITDATDPFETTSLAAASRTEESSLVTFYSPDLGGLSYRLQARVIDEKDIDDNNSTQTSVQAGVSYDFGMGSVHAAYDQRGTNNVGSDFNQDPVTGLSAEFDLGSNAEVGVKYEMEDDVDDTKDTDYTSIAVAVDYGAGDLYAQYQSVSPDQGDSQSQYGVGVSYTLVEDLFVYGEFANLDGQNDADKDTLAAFGLTYEF